MRNATCILSRNCLIWLKRGSGCASDLRLGGIVGNAAMFLMKAWGPFAAAIGERIRVFDSIGSRGARPRWRVSFGLSNGKPRLCMRGIAIRPSE